jgi:hypothetical protein
MMFSPFVTVHKVAHDARARSKAGVEGVCVFHSGNQDANDFGRREFAAGKVAVEHLLEARFDNAANNEVESFAGAGCDVACDGRKGFFGT